MWFVLERLDPIPVEALLEAGRMLASGLRTVAPEQRISVRMFGAGNVVSEPVLGL
jgi:hypothetical protein